VLPNMYADFVSYNARKAVLWGGHSGDLSRLEEFFPVIRKPISYFVARYKIAYLVIDLEYTTPDRLQLDVNAELLEQFGSICVFHVSTPIAENLSVGQPHLSRSG